MFTPIDRRACGYASGLVSAVSDAIRAEGHRAILSTDLGNAGSNSLYRALGCRAVAEGIRYRFDGSP